MASQAVMPDGQLRFKPRSWWLPLTYRPKICPVRLGKIRQTIRPGVKYMVGDQVAFHGWEGAPYRSQWSFRTSLMPLTEALAVTVTRKGMIFPHHSSPRHGLVSNGLYSWRHPLVHQIARLDGIDPADGEELGRLLLGMYVIEGRDARPFQIIRW